MYTCNSVDDCICEIAHSAWVIIGQNTFKHHIRIYICSQNCMRQYENILARMDYELENSDDENEELDIPDPPALVRQ